MSKKQHIFVIRTYRLFIMWQSLLSAVLNVELCLFFKALTMVTASLTPWMRWEPGSRVVMQWRPRRKRWRQTGTWVLRIAAHNFRCYFCFYERMKWGFVMCALWTSFFRVILFFRILSKFLTLQKMSHNAWLGLNVFDGSVVFVDLHPDFTQWITNIFFFSLKISVKSSSSFYSILHR